METYILLGILIGCVMYSVLTASFVLALVNKEKHNINLHKKIEELEKHVEEQLYDISDQMERLEKEVYDNDSK